jgi:DNA-binding GntR family transcriptional regulator
MSDPETISLPDNLGRELLRHLEREIIRLRWPPGARLAVEEICRRYGVSRSPVREALQVLEADGLAERRPRRGVHVAPITVERLDELYACRVPLEGIAAAGAVRHATPELVARVEAALAAMEQAATAGSAEDAYEANVGLTDLLHAHSGNGTLRRILAMLDKQALRYRFYCYQETDEVIHDDIRANRKLVQAIARGDAGTAQAVTERLIECSWKAMRRVVLARTAERAA